MRLIFSTYLVCSYLLAMSQTEAWLAPKSADKLVNPIPASMKTIELGKSIYNHQCKSCHGIKGRGDGIGSVGLEKAPADFRISLTSGQSDGSLYWKITTGKPPMGSYKQMLNEEEIWCVIHYIKSIASKKKK